MKEFKGTPGPWVWQDDGGVYSWLGPVGCGPLEAVHHDGSAWGEYSADIDVDGYDAKLIAAAPKLLEALRQLRDYVQDCYLQAGDESMMDTDHPMRLAASAIARALGEQS